MRIPKTWVPPIAKKIAESIVNTEQVEPKVDMKTFIEITETLVMDELMVEDKVNDEVRQILRQHEGEIDKGNLDYRKLFDMTKQKIVRERNLVL